MASVLVIGGGGREHALAWKLAQSSKVETVLVAPGNGGTCEGKVKNVPGVGVNDVDGIIALCKENNVELVVVGPEDPLADGLADVLWRNGFPVFGPQKSAAMIEASKAFSKDFMARHNIPTARYANFTDATEALKYVTEADHDVVIKASGLAAGKGVLIPKNKEEALAAVKAVMLDQDFGSAGDEIVIEELMVGPEASILAVSDGFSAVCFPAAQDHKRAYDGDKGPNTGGMGAYCPAPVVTAALAKRIEKTIIQPCIDGLRKEGCPFVGCLFTGVMITENGPQCLEYNCRFGDPETEAVLPLLDDTAGDDLFTIFKACANRCLDSVNIVFKDQVASTVVVASPGYPGKYPKGLELIVDVQKGGCEEKDKAHVFHAGTKRDEKGLVTSGGRVLTVTGVGADLETALKISYAGVHAIKIISKETGEDVKMFRTDIAYQARTTRKPLRLGVLGSTRGTDMLAIIQAIEARKLNASIEVVVSNLKKAEILDKARTYYLPWAAVSGKNKTREEYDEEVSTVLKKHKVDLVLCIGYMRIISSPFVQEWDHKILNVHPSLLPAFAGGMDGDVYQAVLDAKVVETGCTVHWIDEGVDTGGIVVQKKCTVEANETAASLKKKVQALEGVAFIEAIEGFMAGTLPEM